MSRSYRKPWVKDPANRYMKRIHAQAYRSRCKQIIRVWTKHWVDPYLWIEYDDPVFPSKHEVTNQYDIYDFNFYIFKRRKAYRSEKDYKWSKVYVDNTEGYLKACRK